MFYRKLLTLLVFFFAAIGVLNGYHIVGGEIELVHVEGFTYRIRLIQYFDRAQSENNSPDASARVFIFRNSDHEQVGDVTLFWNRTETVYYTNPECAIGELSTSREIYETEIVLDEATYSDPEGYYVVWERCCRNSNVVNVVSPDRNGMTYVLDFPAVVRDGERFINSSPQLFPPLSDYACVNQLFYADFAGVDIDGDSLVYSLATPLKNSITEFVALPLPQAKPLHSELDYANGFDPDNIVPGDPSLSITRDGYLTVNPENVGLYVFSVKVEEYRDQVKIGELRRDFQMLVVDGCEPPTPPDAEVRLPGETGFYNEVDVLQFTVGDEDRCFEFLVTDEAGTNVNFKAEGVNFDGDANEIFNLSSGPINSDGDTLRVEVCIPACPYVSDGPYIMDLIASDNACPLPQRDTVRMYIDVEPPPNNDPYFEVSTLTTSVEIDWDSQYTDRIIIKDDDLDSIDFYFYTPDFDPKQYGMSYEVIRNEEGEKEVEFQWDTNCLQYFFGIRNEFQLGLVIDDYDECGFVDGDTVFYDLKVNVPPNESPELSSDLSNTIIDVDIQDPMISFNVESVDLDGDMINLNAIGDGFDLRSIGISFPEQTGAGTLAQGFELVPSCSVLNINESTSYTIYFTTEDDDHCREVNRDTLEVTINVNVPLNTAPEFTSPSNLPMYEQQLYINEELRLDITALDMEGHQISIDLLNAAQTPSSESFQLERRTGNGQVTTELIWTPECYLLGPNRSPQMYEMILTAWDTQCPNPESSQMLMRFEVRELPVDYTIFEPPNAFTPNGDNYNDTFSLYDLPQPENNLPPDNCEDQFQSIVIFDRNGRNVFSSTSREFEWTGGGHPSGTYFYQIDYLKTRYKGTLTIIR